MSYSYDPNYPAGWEPIPISEIVKGDVFTYEGANGKLFRATADAHYNEEKTILIVESEDVDFKVRNFAHAKGSLGYAPKYFRVHL